jgi:hypothetical protein
MSNTSKYDTVIDEIQCFITDNKIRIIGNTTDVIDSVLIPVNLSIRGKTYTIQINDEYHDLACNNDLLHVILVFRELAIINDTTDFLHWCTLHEYDANNNQLLDYYRNLCTNMEEITSCFKNNEIDYFISDLDFQLNAGVIQLLRKS